MAERTARLPNPPDVNRSWRRISTGKLSFLYTEEKILPNYLRSPTASCHDVCKYGRKHEPPRVSPLKRVHRSLSGTLNLDSPLRKKALSKTVLPPGKWDSVNGSDHSKSVLGNFSTGICDVRKKKKKKAVSVSESRLADSSKRKKKTVSQSFKTFGVSTGRAKEIAEHNKRVTALKLKAVAQTAAQALRRSSVNRKKINGASVAAEPKKAFVLSRVPMSPKRCSTSLREKKDTSSLSVPIIKAEKQVDDKCKDLVEEKTLYVIKMETGNESIESGQNQRCVMDSPTDDPSSAQPKSQEAAEDCPETECDNASFSEDQKRTRQGKSKTESAVNGKTMRLRFKRGKIVDVGSQDNSPRKLKFKRGKMVDRSSKSGNSQRNLKTKGTSYSNEKEQQEEHKPKSLQVVLKHQETQKHRDSRALLLNNVIEETANKLVETRKSKVKALVGAFESVISLQEKSSSPSTTTTTT